MTSVQKIGIKFPAQSLDASQFVTTTALNTEVARAEAAESALSTRITTNTNGLAAEITRAEAAETANTSLFRAGYDTWGAVAGIHTWDYVKNHYANWGAASANKWGNL